ncbi:ligase-associated DNA damage response DEXH box helicase [Hydrogenophaga sp. IBVHS2]|uniref:ligase-associated DNA damage response DEXH box helicase n=1 Tax=Hydrogenophaga sp. IBVHS2 TaxID=1985170 RepID=UPI000A2E9395|nr:ligase-associated DNA damage response DEXH box helicase [Hydrogenophaga sp. IBVHS2]OSZ62940.1 DNA ligase-associated DEXH box helicase [Hydrogenophaga sp. IBVHS2]
MPQHRADRATAWMAARGWQPFEFQRSVWAAQAEGRSGLLHATTGAGKTYAVWLGLVDRLLSELPTGRTPAVSVLWITPMRALASDSAAALREPLGDMAPAWTLGQRTGDTPSAERARQDRRLPTVLVTTPESLSLLLARDKAPQELASVRAVVVDEWHELIGSKRGVQVQLALARLRRWQPGLITWGMSATLGNLDEARQVLCGPDAARSAAPPSVLVQGRVAKTLRIDTLIPPDPGRYSWSGHLGSRMQEPVVRELDGAGTALVFTNTRSQAEIWYQLLLQHRPDWAGQVALHHGSLDKTVREWVEAGLKGGQLKAVVATSSLDLGVDFLPVERVLQIGSAKGVARLLQRAGRSGHAPGRPSRITLVPTNTLELVEAAAVREAALAGRIEPRHSPHQPLDVLVQHLVTVALGGGFEADALFEEVRTAWAYRDLGREAFDWALAFCERGGDSLTAYPDYHRLARDETGVWRVPDTPQGRATARRHRWGVGTIVSDASLRVQYQSGGSIGSIEEGFISRLRKGDCFVFAGRLLEFVRVHDMTAWVKKATRHKGAVPTWQGGKMPLSTELADAVLEQMALAEAGRFDSPELQAARPMLATQAQRSRLPLPGVLLVERFRSKEGHHLCLFPFAGRHVHLGLASLLAWRLAREQPNTFSLSVNDYGFELLAADEPDLSRLLDGSVLSSDDLLAHVMASLNAGELAQRRFREIARIAGLVFSGQPGAPRSLRQLQASSGLFFEVFRKYDPGNLLLRQAETEVLSQELEIGRLRDCLQRMAGQRLELVELDRPSPMSLPLMVERLRERLSTEQLSARLERMLRELEEGA